MLTFLKDLRRRLRYPWLPGHVHRRIQPLRFSRLTPERIGECLEFYEGNVPHGLPEDHHHVYREALETERILTYVADTEHGMAGTFGLQWGYQPGVVWLCYVMVRPDQHRRGIGATLWLASMGVQQDLHAPRVLAISAVPRALGFYERLGFLQAGQTPHTNGEMHTLAVFNPVTSEVVRGSRQLLHAAGATLPDGFHEIPKAAQAERVGSMTS